MTRDNLGDRATPVDSAAIGPGWSLALASDSGRLARRSISRRTSTRNSPRWLVRRSAECHPSAYRLAEPGDTLDRIMLYFAAASVVVLPSAGLVLNRGGMLWPAGSAARFGRTLWYSATPGPTVDGWYGLGWRTIADPQAPPVVRATLSCGAIFLGSIVGWTLVRQRGRLAAYWVHSGANGTRWLWITGWVLVLARQFDLPGDRASGLLASLVHDRRACRLHTRDLDRARFRLHGRSAVDGWSCPMGSALLAGARGLGNLADLVSSPARTGSRRSCRGRSTSARCPRGSAWRSLRVVIIFARSSTFFPSRLPNAAPCCS